MQGALFLTFAGLIACGLAQNLGAQEEKFSSHLPVDIRCRTDTTNKLHCGVHVPKTCQENWNFKNPCTPANLARNLTLFPHPFSEEKFLMCGDFGKLFVVLCPRYEVFHKGCRQCVAKGSKLTAACEVHDVPLAETVITNPCTTEAILTGKLFYPFPGDLGKYIHCDAWGKAWEMICTPGEIWDVYKVACVNPLLMNPCAHSTRAPGHLFKHPCDPTHYIRCDAELIPYEVPCGPNEYFSEINQVCQQAGQYTNPPQNICGLYNFRFRSYTPGAFATTSNQQIISSAQPQSNIMNSLRAAAAGTELKPEIYRAWEDTVSSTGPVSVGSVDIGVQDHSMINMGGTSSGSSATDPTFDMMATASSGNVIDTGLVVNPNQIDAAAVSRAVASAFDSLTKSGAFDPTQQGPAGTLDVSGFASSPFDTIQTSGPSNTMDFGSSGTGTSGSNTGAMDFMSGTQNSASSIDFGSSGAAASGPNTGAIDFTSGTQNSASSGSSDFGMSSVGDPSAQRTASLKIVGDFSTTQGNVANGIIDSALASAQIAVDGSTGQAVTTNARPIDTVYTDPHSGSSSTGFIAEGSVLSGNVDSGSQFSSGPSNTAFASSVGSDPSTSAGTAASSINVDPYVAGSSTSFVDSPASSIQSLDLRGNSGIADMGMGGAGDTFATGTGPSMSDSTVVVGGVTDTGASTGNQADFNSGMSHADRPTGTNQATNTMAIDSSTGMSGTATGTGELTGIDALAKTIGGIIASGGIPGVEFASASSQNTAGVSQTNNSPIVDAASFGPTDTSNVFNGGGQSSASTFDSSLGAFETNSAFHTGPADKTVGGSIIDTAVNNDASLGNIGNVVDLSTKQSVDAFGGNTAGSSVDTFGNVGPSSAFTGSDTTNFETSALNTVPSSAAGTDFYPGSEPFSSNTGSASAFGIESNTANTGSLDINQGSSTVNTVSTNEFGFDTSPSGNGAGSMGIPSTGQSSFDSFSSGTGIASVDRTGADSALATSSGSNFDATLNTGSSTGGGSFGANQGVQSSMDSFGTNAFDVSNTGADSSTSGLSDGIVYDPGMSGTASNSVVQDGMASGSATSSTAGFNSIGSNGIQDVSVRGLPDGRTSLDHFVDGQSTSGGMFSNTGSNTQDHGVAGTTFLNADGSVVSNSASMSGVSDGTGMPSMFNNGIAGMSHSSTTNTGMSNSGMATSGMSQSGMSTTGGSNMDMSHIGTSNSGMIDSGMSNTGVSSSVDHGTSTGVQDTAASLLHPSLAREYDYSEVPFAEPCTKENIMNSRTHFRIRNYPHSFIQCNREGSMYVMKCNGDLLFDVATRSCYSKALANARNGQTIGFI